MATHQKKRIAPRRWSREFLPRLELLAVMIAAIKLCHSEPRGARRGEAPACCRRKQTTVSSSHSLLGMTKDFLDCTFPQTNMADHRSGGPPDKFAWDGRCPVAQ